MEVYLAGPITEGRADRTDWRDEVTTILAFDRIVARSPSPKQKYQDEYGISGREAQMVLTVRDNWFSTKCDVVLANFEGSQKASIGTSIEIGWASNAGVPVVAAIPEGNVHEHPMILNSITVRCYSLEEAVRVVLALNGGRL